MRREDIADLAAYLVVAEEGSFTRAASKLNLTQSALSQIVKRLEERLGVRLLTRTTRSVSTTEAGEKLVRTLSPMFREIDQSITDLGVYRDKPAGTVRITTVEHAAKTILVPKLTKLLESHPEISVEINVDYGRIDIVAEHYDAGVRLGEQVAKDMIAVRLSPDIPMAIVGTPAYLKKFGRPRKVKDLLSHRCINLRLTESGEKYAWHLVQDGSMTRVRVAGPISCNNIDLIRDATLNGSGLSFLPLDQVEQELANGELEKVLGKHLAPLPGYHLYYPNRRHSPPAFKAVVDALRYPPMSESE